MEEGSCKILILARIPKYFDQIGTSAVQRMLSRCPQTAPDENAVEHHFQIPVRLRFADNGELVLRECKGNPPHAG